MTVETKSALHDATPSWNGFNYQGKVGIYVCLEMIKKAIIEHGINTPGLNLFLEQHSIEYEWIEDFAIKNGDAYLSLHQVKHKAGTAFSDHIEAIVTILNRKQKVLSSTDLNKYIKLSLIEDEELVPSLHRVLGEMVDSGYLNAEHKLAQNWRNVTSEIERVDTNDLVNCLSDFESFSSNAFDAASVYFHTAEAVTSPMRDINTYTGIPTRHHVITQGLKTLTSLNIYLGCDDLDGYKLVLSDTALLTEIEAQISEILQLTHGEQEVFSPDDKQIYIAALLKLIDSHILERHHRIRANTNTGAGFNEARLSLDFQDIYNVLNSNFRNHNEQYWELFCRKNFENAYSEYIRNFKRNIELGRRIEENKQAIDNIEKYRELALSPYLKINIIELMKIIFPHIPYEGDDQLFYIEISNASDIKTVFLKFIEGVSTSSAELSFQCSKNRKYQPTGIDLRADDEWERMDKLENFKNNIVKNDVRNKNNFNGVGYLVINASPEHEINYETVYLETITEGLNNTLLENDEHHIMTPNQVELMHYTKAIEVLNGE